MSVWLSILRWIARLSALLVAGSYLLMLFGEVMDPHSAPPSTFVEWAGIGLTTIACIALLIAWRWELAGAMLSLACLMAFAMLIQGGSTFHAAILVMATPGILYVIDWFVRRESAARHHA